MENLKLLFLEVRLEIILYILGKLESLKKTFSEDQFMEFRNLLLEEKVLVENKLK